MKFEESGLVFNFPVDWKVIKWDEHRFFGYVSGRGFKGVDFMAIHNGELYLIEVKNYRDRRPDDGQHPFDLLGEKPDFYAEVFLQKYSDSFDLIDIVKKYYLRKWFFKWWSKSNFRGLNTVAQWSFFKNKDFIFWTQAAEILHHHPKKVHLKLWLEPGPKISVEKYSNLKKKLVTYFEKNPILPEGGEIELEKISDIEFPILNID